MKVTLNEPKYLKDSISIISELVNEVNLKFSSNMVELVATDPANVALVDFKLLSSAFSEYEVPSDKVIGINLSNFTQILKRVKSSDILTLELDEDRNRLKVTLKGITSRDFNLSLIDIDEKEQKIPKLSFNAKIHTNTLLLADAIEDMDVVSDNLSFIAKPNLFIIKSDGNLSSAKVEISGDEETIINSGEDEILSKYSIEYLKKIMKGSKLSSSLTLEFGENYPLKVEFRVIDKLNLGFILAPRTAVD